VEVCHELNPDKLKRKLGGLWEAMRFSDKKTAMLITLEQVDEFEDDGFEITVLPFHSLIG